MKHLILTIIIILISQISQAQQIINDSIVHDGMYRTYILYVPASYTGEQAPLVMNLHGYTSSAFEQMFYGDFRPVADTAGFLLVHPNGTDDPSGNQYWNAEWGGNVDDIGFLESLIDSLALEYNIDMSRVYSTGMSNGGFMSYTLACNINNRIASIASVTGTMTKAQLNSCSPQHPTPIMEIHGTDDLVVPYNGNIFWASSPQVVEYWTTYNQCETVPLLTTISDNDPNDGCTAELYEYYNGTSGSKTIHYKILGGGHTWPGSPINTGNGNTCQDFNACSVIWNFFRQYDLNGIITSIDENNLSQDITIYPNPASDIFHVKMNFPSDYRLKIYNYMGHIVHEDRFVGYEYCMSADSFTNGIYVLQVTEKNNRCFGETRFIVSKP